MRQVNLAGLDLNLLPALEALIRRRNVTRAAEDVGLSQPAMSRALARLRSALGDPLLVRAPGGLAPTARALTLEPQLAAALDALGGLYRVAEFSPARLRRAFHIGASDAQTVMIAPALLASVREAAPDVDLRFEPYGSDMRARLEQGELDLIFALTTTPLPPGAFSEAVARDRLALVMRRDHPAAARSWTKADYGRVDHVTVAIRGDDQSDIDAELARDGVARRIVLRTPHFVAALAAVGATDAVTTLSAALARRFASVFGLILAAPPLDSLDLELAVVGAATRAADPALKWLVAKVREAAGEAYRT